MRLPSQCAILVGGLGTRLAELTERTPKPLLECGGQPFLAHLIREISRFGIDRFVLLAGFQAAAVRKFASNISNYMPKPVEITVSVEPSPLGTGGALYNARSHLDDSFLLINGDSWFDVNLARFFSAWRDETSVGHLLLRYMDDASRYGIVDVREGRICAFHDRPDRPMAGTINAGIYLFDERIFEYLRPSCSLEREILPLMANSGLLSACSLSGYFIDIGVPADYERAVHEMPERTRRGAVFFDRDGVLNEDLGWVGSRDRFQWMRGAIEAVRLVNDRGLHAFVVTNQSGVARGLYSESDVRALHAFMVSELRAQGATIDDWRYCPFHADAVLPQYREDSFFRKPQPGMIISLAEAWDVDKSRSVLIGDNESDIEAATRAGLRSILYQGDESLVRVVQGLEERM